LYVFHAISLARASQSRTNTSSSSSFAENYPPLAHNHFGCRKCSTEIGKPYVLKCQQKRCKFYYQKGTPPTPPLPPGGINFPKKRADYFAFGKENDDLKVKNPRVLAERNTLSIKIFDVREIAHKIPQCEKGPAGKERFFPEKGGNSPDKWPKIPPKRLKFRNIQALKMNQNRPPREPPESTVA
jgi:hypothetical protein